MKLKRTHFFDPEPESVIVRGNPKLKDHQIVLGHTNVEGETFTEAHSAWKARNVKPEEPKSSYADNKELTWLNRIAMEIGTPEEREEWGKYFKALQHYEENRRRWDGFKTKRHDNGVNYYTDDISVWFYDSHDCVKVFLPKKSSSVSMFDGLSVSLFEQICEENGIKLSKL